MRDPGGGDERVDRVSPAEVFRGIGSRSHPHAGLLPALPDRRTLWTLLAATLARWRWWSAERWLPCQEDLCDNRHLEAAALHLCLSEEDVPALPTASEFTEAEYSGRHPRAGASNIGVRHSFLLA